MADTTNEQVISAGNVGMTAKGAWSATASYVDYYGVTHNGYETGDTVTANNSLYESLKDDNTAPVTDTTAWRLDADGSQVAASVDVANKAAAAANASKEAIEKNEANRQDAEKLRQQNAASAVTAETAREQAETERKAAADKQAADYLTLYNSLEAKAAEVDRKITELTTTNSAASLVGCPARITVETERTASVGSVLNISPRQIEPSTANRSCIYKVYTGAALVDFRGNVQLPTEPGDSVIEVIPTLNSGAAEKVTIHAVALETVQDITGEAVTDENGEEITA